MTSGLNATHDPALHSWVESANLPTADFPIQNLALAAFRRAGSAETFRAGVAIGDQILDLRDVGARQLLTAGDAEILADCAEPTLNRLMARGSGAATRLRASLSAALSHGSPWAAPLASSLVPQAHAEYALPATIGDYTDFYTSIHHARTVGAQFRPDNPLLPNYRWLPIAYHGRSSSIGVSGQDFHRPAGQSLPPGAKQPSFGPSRRLDFELELGFYIGAGNAPGAAIAVEAAEQHVFGACLLNDWSARDLQGWEYQPLGPFLGKNFATTLSPWVVTWDALAPFRLPFTRPAGDPEPLAYLDSPTVRARGMLDIELDVALQTAQMRAMRLPPHVLATSNSRHAYWTVAQMVAHHAVNGCNLRAGDLLGSGTLSGPLPSQAGSLLELTAGGTRDLELPTGETRGYLADGDRVLLRAWCQRAGQVRIGFGTAIGTVLPARVDAL